MSNFISRAWGRYRRTTGIARAVTTLALAAVVGLIIVPLCIWAGGELVIGAYQRDPLATSTGGPVALWSDYLRGLAEGSLPNWIACVGPYVIYLVFKLGRTAFRA